MSANRKHPMQPTYTDEHGVLRFVPNGLILGLFNAGLLDLNKMAVRFRQGDYQADWEQLAQLLGYSLDGYLDLSYVSDETADIVEAMLTDSPADGANGGAG